MNLNRYFKIITMSALFIITFTIPAAAGQFRVVGVDDGDTLRVSGNGKVFWVRLAGIDAPEKPKSNLAPGQPFFYEAKEFLADRTLYKSVEVQTRGKDRYGSVLGVVFINEKNINLALVEYGLAEASADNLPDDFDMEPYRAAEVAAKTAKKGMWILGDTYMSPREWRERQKKK